MPTSPPLKTELHLPCYSQSRDLFIAPSYGAICKSVKAGNGMLLLRITDGNFARSATMNYSLESVFLIACSTLAIYNTLELVALIFMTFKERKGLYFWSILLASLGAIPYCVGGTVQRSNVTLEYIGLILNTIGWVLLVTGQSVVLYSRLHLVLNNITILRAIRWMIICNGVVWHTSLTVLELGFIYSQSQTRRDFNTVFHIMERVQVTCFCLQEFIISGLYIWGTVDILETAFGNKRRFLWRLFGINVLIVVMDIALLTVEYKGYYIWQVGLKVAVYSIKLKVEFAVLGELVHFVHRHGGTNYGPPPSHSTVRFVEIPGSRSQPVDKEALSSKMPEVIHMEDLQTSAVVATTSKISPCQDNEPHQMVTPMMDTENSDLDPGYDRSTDQLYDDAIQQISRSY